MRPNFFFKLGLSTLVDKLFFDYSMQLPFWTESDCVMLYNLHLPIRIIVVGMELLEITD